MSKIRFKLDRKAVRGMLRSQEAQAAVTRAAESVASRAGEGFKVEARTSKRARAYVHATTRAAQKAAANHALEFAVLRGG